VLARIIEDAGIATTLITPMPFWAEKIGTPRTLAVEHPFGQLLGRPFDTKTQSGVLFAALNLLTTTHSAGEISTFESTWPVPTKDALTAWQPKEPSPIIAVMGDAVRERLRQQRAKITNRPA
jgi:hypothetical protein